MATNNADNFSNPIGVSTGGTGVASLTTYAPLCGGTTTTGTIQQATTGIGTSSYILMSNGASALPSWQNGTAGLVKIVTLTASASASLTLTSSNITSTYTSYLIVIEHLGPSTSSANQLIMTFSTNNGSTYLSTGYQSAIMSVSFSGTTWTNTTTTTGAYVGGNFGTGGHTMNGQVFINIPQSAIVSYVGRVFMSLVSPTMVTSYGNNSGTTTVNNIKFALAAGSMNQGTITLYGIPQ